MGWEGGGWVGGEGGWVGKAGGVYPALEGHWQGAPGSTGSTAWLHEASVAAGTTFCQSHATQCNSAINVLLMADCREEWT